MIESDYGAALTAAKKCTPGATNQCQELVNSSLSCPGCKQYVNDTTMLSAIQTEWDDNDLRLDAPRLPGHRLCLADRRRLHQQRRLTGACTNGQLTPAELRTPPCVPAS